MTAVVRNLPIREIFLGVVYRADQGSGDSWKCSQVGISQKVEDCQAVFAHPTLLQGACGWPIVVELLCKPLPMSHDMNNELYHDY